jgi:hypothetical protein
LDTDFDGLLRFVYRAKEDALKPLTAMSSSAISSNQSSSVSDLDTVEVIGSIPVAPIDSKST